jgi:hypothetical protein
VDDDARLAAAGTREHEQRSLAVEHGLALGVVQALEERVGRRHGAGRIIEAAAARETAGERASDML